MVRRALTTTGITLAAAVGLVVTTQGTASANVTVSAVGGKEQVSVTINSTDLRPQVCYVYIAGANKASISVPAKGTGSTVISGVAPGSTTVTFSCTGGAPVPAQTVQVTAANSTPDGGLGGLLSGLSSGAKPTAH